MKINNMDRMEKVFWSLFEVFLVLCFCSETKSSKTTSIDLNNCTVHILPARGYVMTHLETTDRFIRDCDVIITSARQSGRICLSQYRRNMQIGQENLRFLASDDNHQHTKWNLTYKDIWTPITLCTHSSRLILRLSPVEKGKPKKYRTLIAHKNYLKLMLTDIHSLERFLYLDGEERPLKEVSKPSLLTECNNQTAGHGQPLSNSWVNLMSVLPNELKIFNDSKPSRECFHFFFKDPPNIFARMCAIIMPIPKVKCGKNWKLLFEPNGKNGKGKRIMTCEQVKEYKPFTVICMEDDLDFDPNYLYLTVHTPEQDKRREWFRLVVLDSEDNDDDIRNYVKNVIEGYQVGLSLSISALGNHWLAYGNLSDQYNMVKSQVDKSVVDKHQVYDDIITVTSDGENGIHCSINLAECPGDTPKSGKICYCMNSPGATVPFLVIAGKMGSERKLTVTVSPKPRAWWIDQTPSKTFVVGTIPEKDYTLYYILLAVLVPLTFFVGFFVGLCATAYKIIRKKNVQKESTIADNAQSEKAETLKSIPSEKSAKSSSNNGADVDEDFKSVGVPDKISGVGVGQSIKNSFSWFPKLLAGSTRSKESESSKSESIKVERTLDVYS